MRTSSEQQRSASISPAASCKSPCPPAYTTDCGTCRAATAAGARAAEQSRASLGRPDAPSTSP
eukprot:scaffold739_cov105-Phaeocystis_antarctica.AAC.4